MPSTLHLMLPELNKEADMPELLHCSSAALAQHELYTEHPPLVTLGHHPDG
jgi:hypothetical protein